MSRLINTTTFFVVIVALVIFAGSTQSAYATYTGCFCENNVPESPGNCVDDSYADISVNCSNVGGDEFGGHFAGELVTAPPELWDEYETTCDPILNFSCCVDAGDGTCGDFAFATAYCPGNSSVTASALNYSGIGPSTHLGPLNPGFCGGGGDDDDDDDDLGGDDDDTPPSTPPTTGGSSGDAIKPIKIDFSIGNPLGSARNDPEDLVKLIAGGFIGILGLFAVVMVIYGGYMFIFSSGNQKMIERGKSTLLWAILGVAAAFLSVSILNFLLSRLG